MPPIRKPDADEVLAFLDRLSREPWIGRAREPWTRTIYHYSDVSNIAQVLLSGFVRSRRRLAQMQETWTEIADRQIIVRTPWAHRYARFYMRPRTPMQFNVEGILPRGANGQPPSPHCPVPVFLLFDNRGMLTREACIYTDGNFASTTSNTDTTAAFLRRRDFRLIYHDEAFAHAERQAIIHARATEVLFEHEVDLDDLRAVVCRTPAERSTLLAALGAEWRQWAPRIRLEEAGERLFIRTRRTYVEEVRFVAPNEVVARLSVSDADAHECRAIVRPLHGDPTYERAFGPPLPTELRINIPHPPPEWLDVELQISGSPAYHGYVSTQRIFAG